MFLKKNYTVIKTHLNTLSAIMIMISQMTGYARKFDENATMSFIVKNKQLLKKYTKIWEKNEGLMRINLESKPVSGDHDKYIKTKIKYMQGV